MRPSPGTSKIKDLGEAFAGRSSQKSRLGSPWEDNEAATAGARFSHVYIDRGAPTQDSVRMRRRIGSQVWEFKPLADELRPQLQRELGMYVPTQQHGPTSSKR
jgi:hypothetical protein